MYSNSRGLTFFEVVIVMAVLAIVSAFVVPGIIDWRSDMKLRSAANNLKGDLEMAKARAIRENNYVAVLFQSGGYVIFVDNGAGPGAGGPLGIQLDELKKLQSEVTESARSLEDSVRQEFESARAAVEFPAQAAVAELNDAAQQVAQSAAAPVADVTGKPAA